MNITLNITKKFNTLVNYDYFFDSAPMKPVIFLDFHSQVRDEFEFELMNFGLNINDEMRNCFRGKSPYFGNIAGCSYEYERIIIFNRAKFNFSGFKGADVRFTDMDNPINGEKFYYTWPYKVEKDDFDFVCGGYSSFSPHFTTINVIGNSNAQATITFSSEDYILIDDESNEIENIAAGKQTVYNYLQTQKISLPSGCSNVVGKMFDPNFREKHFDLVYGEDFHTTIATNCEK